MAASISMSVLVNADDIDKAEIDVFDGTSGPIASFDIQTSDGSQITIQGHHTDPHEFAFAVRALGDRLVQAADDWALAQKDGEQS